MRRLVPMPGPKAAPKAAPPAPPPAPMVPTFRNGWPLFVWLIATAVVMYLAKWPILLILALVGFFRGLLWLCDRYPRTMIVLLGFFRGLIGR